ncbi:hypothetical protein ACFQX6_03255 [Streptosporangium lutulentum]
MKFSEVLNRKRCTLARMCTGSHARIAAGAVGTSLLSTCLLGVGSASAAAQPLGEAQPPAAAQPNGKTQPTTAAQPNGEAQPPATAQPNGKAQPTTAAPPAGEAAGKASTCLAASSAKASKQLRTLGAEQKANAAIVIEMASKLGLPTRAAVIGVATSLQESQLRNLNYGDRDSLGLFQQRPSQGWGTRKQILNPKYSARKFYQGLATVSHWKRLPLTQAAQAVQRSGFPDAYAKWEKLAKHVVRSHSCRPAPAQQLAANTQTVAFEQQYAMDVPASRIPHRPEFAE